MKEFQNKYDKLRSLIKIMINRAGMQFNLCFMFKEWAKSTLNVRCKTKF